MSIIKNPSGALFSPCRRWRYLLWRRWDPEKPIANFLMLNPSTADEVKLDPSCTRAREYARRWGYGGLIVTNIFGWRATDPRDLRRVKEPIGKSTDRAIVRAAQEADLVVCAWGNHGLYCNRSERVAAILRKADIPLHALRLTQADEPMHVLYLPSALKPVRWRR